MENRKGTQKGFLMVSLMAIQTDCLMENRSAMCLDFPMENQTAMQDRTHQRHHRTHHPHHRIHSGSMVMLTDLHLESLQTGLRLALMMVSPQTVKQKGSLQMEMLTVTRMERQTDLKMASLHWVKLMVNRLAMLMDW